MPTTYEVMTMGSMATASSETMATMSTIPTAGALQDNTNRNIGIGVGVGVGGALLILLAVIVVVALIIHFKKQRRHSKYVLNYNTVYGKSW